MIPVPAPRYYKVSFVRDDETAALQYCVPESWVIVTCNEKKEAMVAYPEEPEKITEERARRCQYPRETWKLFAAKIRGTTNHFSSLICNDDEWNHVEDNWLPSTTTQPVPSYTSTSAQEKQYNKSSRATFQILDMDAIEMLKRDLLEAYEKLRAAVDPPRPLGIGHKIYIKSSDLDECEKLARNCLHLARLLTRPIFSDEAMKKCIYVGKNAPRPDLTLDEDAVVAIVHFVWSFGLDNNWKLPSERSIRNAIRYELLMAKEKTA